MLNKLVIALAIITVFGCKAKKQLVKTESAPVVDKSAPKAEVLRKITAGNADFNVVIRSFTWNAETGYFSLSTGSAITEKADPDQEFDECQLKAEALIKSLSSL